MYYIYLACCGPTFPGSCALLAVIWKSAIAPDSIPNASLQLPVNGEHMKKKNRKREGKKDKSLWTTWEIC